MADDIGKVQIEFGATIADLKSKISEAKKLVDGLSPEAKKNGAIIFDMNLDELKKNVNEAKGIIGDLVKNRPSPGSKEGAVAIKLEAETEEFKGKIGESVELLSTLQEHFLALASVFAGGVAFKEFIDAVKEVDDEALKLSNTIGITVSQSAILSVALDDSRNTVESYTSAFEHFNRKLSTSSDAMRDMGVDVDALKNGQKSSNEVFQEAISIINQYKPGVDRTQASMALFGRSVSEVIGLQRLFGGSTEDVNKRMEEARETAEKLNLTVSEDGLKAMLEYKGALNNVGDVLTGVKKTIGEQIIPIFTEMGNEFASSGESMVEVARSIGDAIASILSSASESIIPVLGLMKSAIDDIGRTIGYAFGQQASSAMDIFRESLGLVAGALNSFKIGLNLIVETIKGFSDASDSMGAKLDNLRSKLFSFVSAKGYGAGVKDAFTELLGERQRLTQKYTDKILEITTKGANDFAEIDKKFFNRPKKSINEELESNINEDLTGSFDSGKKFDFGKKEDTHKVQQAKSAVEKAGYEASKALQLEYLSEYQRELDSARSQNLVSDKDYFTAKLAGEKLSADQAIDAKKRELDSQKSVTATAKTEEDKLKSRAEEIKLAGEINVLEAKKSDLIRASTEAYNEQVQKRKDAEATLSATSGKASADAAIALQKSSLSQQQALRRIDAQQAFATQRDLEEQSYAATQAFITSKRSLIHGDNEQAKEEELKLAVESEAAEQVHQQKLTDISNAANLEREKYAVEAQQSAQNSVQHLFEDMLNGTTKLSEVFHKFGLSIANEFASLASKKITESIFDATGANEALSKVVNSAMAAVKSIVTGFIGGETAKTTAATAGTATRSAASVGEAATSTVASETAAVAGVTASGIHTAAAVADATVRATADVGAAAVGTTATVASASVGIAARAWEAAAGVYAALAAIPVVGPVLAPAAAIAAGAAVLGFIGRIASSEGGEYQVGEDRLNFVHKDETILPAPFARGLRDMIGGKGTPQSTGWSAPQYQLPSVQPTQAAAISGPSSSAPVMAGDVHLHVSAVDAASVKKLFMEHGKSLATALKAQGRNFVPAR